MRLPKLLRSFPCPSSTLVLLAIALGAAGCGKSGNVAPKHIPATGLGCTVNSECEAPLVCTWARCHAQCSETRDCPIGERCVLLAAGGLCQLQLEARCDYTSDCQSPLVCAIDGKCRSECKSDRDCAKKQVCTPSGGAKVCADLDELNASQMLTPASPPQPRDGGTDVPPSSTTDGPASVLDGGDTGGPATDAPGTDTPPAGDGGSTTCEAPCGVGGLCVAGKCEPCGKSDQICCNGGCDPGLSCSSNKCGCGAANQACCGGMTCNTGLTCDKAQMPPVCACGTAGNACCPEMKCMGDLVCAGVRCGCVTACATASYLDGGQSPHTGAGVIRSDGSVLTNNNTITRLDGSPLKAVTLAWSRDAGAACAVRTDGTVWCWGSNGAGALGIGDLQTKDSLVALQVVTGVGAGALTGIKRVFGGMGSFCAVGDMGKAWCWGKGDAGQLGSGSKANSSFAVPVLTTAGGAQLSGVEQVALGRDYGCARKTDKSLWCWGSNTGGQLGIGQDGGESLFPVQVQTVFNTVLDVAISADIEGRENATCAVTEEGALWCWGTVSNGRLGTGGGEGKLNKPTRVVTAMGGPPFSDAARVMGFSVGFCAVKTGGSLWCWGWGSVTAGFPSPAMAAGEAITDVFQVGEQCLLRKDGRVWSVRGGQGNTFDTPTQSPCQ
jgi:alpha-tubulin suppressor-like RCC1 family protein